MIYSNKSDTLQFGKYKGQTIGTILDSDPSYLKWAYKNTTIFSPTGELKEHINKANTRKKVNRVNYSKSYSTMLEHEEDDEYRDFDYAIGNEFDW